MDYIKKGAQSIGRAIWEKTHSKEVKKEKDLLKGSPPKHDDNEQFTKRTTPAGEDRDIKKETRSKRDAEVEAAEREALRGD